MSDNLQESGGDAVSNAGAHIEIPADGAGEELPRASFTSSAPKTSAPKGRGSPRMGRMAKLKLLARLHGHGQVSWPGSTVTVTYDVDIFGGGATRTASGFLDGDFAAAYESEQDEATGPVATTARLRLEGGAEMAIQITVVATDLAEFDAPLTSAEADLLTSRG
jgi:hypothetical protein